VLAEVLPAEVAIEPQGRALVDGRRRADRCWRCPRPVRHGRRELVDGSGLSTADRVPAQLLGAVLAEAAARAQGVRDTQFLRPIVTGLPVAGGDGTLADRFANGSPSASGRGVVRAKTGTLTGVSSLAGIVTDADGRLLVFALMSNGVNPGLVRPKLDAIAAQLGRCGCR
jgi:D-alanyl-D-alanine carboxypeptidase/D-alanyl-D-alanine-endopeptidase (penicillin-binding protein 4)